MKRSLLVFGLVSIAGSLFAAPQRILLVARDLENRRIPGVRFTYQEAKSGITNRQGETELNLPPGEETGQQITLDLVSGSTATADWFLISRTVTIPNDSSATEVILMRRSTFRLFSQSVLEASAKVRQGKEAAENRRRSLRVVAERFRLKPALVEPAIRSFGDTRDSKDRRIADLLAFYFALGPHRDEILKLAI